MNRPETDRQNPDLPGAIEPSAFQPLGSEQTVATAPRNTKRIVLIALVVVFLLLMFFLLSARSIEIIVQSEEPADISINGLALPFGDRYLLRPGDYTISASAEGYHPLESPVTVGESNNQSIELVLRPLPGKLTIQSAPPGARVFINGEDIGATPLDAVSVEAGEHTLTLRADRYLELEQPLSVTGRNIPQQLIFDLEPGWADIEIDSVPPGATILVDGEEAGTTPAIVEVMAGEERQVILQMANFADWQLALDVEPGVAQTLELINLQPAAGMLELSSTPSGANVTLDGEFLGQTPLELELTPDKAHRLAVFKPGYRRYSSTVQLPAGGQDSQSISLQAQLGEVRFSISPADALVKVDGRPRGRGSQTLSLPAYEQSVEISLDGYNTVRKRVTPRPGLEQLVEVQLRTAAEIRQANIKPEITTALGQTLLLFTPEDAGLTDFTMGASRREPGRRANEVLHPVSLRRPFYLQTHEVTNAQFRLYSKNHNSGQISGQTLNREHQPAVQVSWQQAAAFCNWLSKREGLPPFYVENNGIITGFNPNSIGYRLPTEAEWAWAARVDGDLLLKFPWGDEFPPPRDSEENYADNTSAYVTGRVLGGYKDGYVVSAPVGSFQANQHRLFDMGGNVAEWVNDVYAIPSGKGAIEVDPMGAQTGDNFVIRGASWSHSKIGELRLSYRDYGQAGRDDVGFRLARYLE
ncbi:MAG: PEGA domain-containing protein [Pseudomonadota bacterium]